MHTKLSWKQFRELFEIGLPPTKLKISPQDLKVLEPILPPEKDKPKAGFVAYDSTPDNSDEDEKVNNSSGNDFNNLRLRIDPPCQTVTL